MSPDATEISQLSQSNAEQLCVGLNAFKNAADLKHLEEIRLFHLGKSGIISAEMKKLSTLSAEEKNMLGLEINILKKLFTAAHEEKKNELETAELNERLASETLDVTLPAAPVQRGSIHPITQVTEELIAIFAEFGFTVAEGPEIEDDFHNFSALNIPESHPARQMHDTFYLRGTDETALNVLRTHTSPVQIRTMMAQKPPIRIIAPGTTYRSDSDMTHTPMFHQIEGLVIEKNVHMGHLGLEKLPMRFRASFFPFTEPSAEVDIGCKRGRDALVIGEGTDWLEIAGCGMVHPNVLRNCGIDPEEWQGFAFGCGIERLAMLKYNIPDLRTFFAGDVRWLEHYGFAAADMPSALKGSAA